MRVDNLWISVLLKKPLASAPIIPYYMEVMYRPPNDRQPDAATKPVTVLGSYDEALAVAKEMAKDPILKDMCVEFVIFPLPPQNGTHPYRTSYSVKVNGWNDLPF